VALLIVTFIGASKSLPTSGDRPSDKPDTTGLRPGGFGYYDYDEGVTHLYPVKPGRVAEVFKYDGDEAKDNEPLFRMDDRMEKATWDKAKAGVALAEIQVRRAEDAVRVHQVKYDAEVSAQKEIIAAKKGKADAARAQAAQAKRLADSEQGPQETATAAAKGVEGLDAEVRAEEAKLRGMEALKEPTDLKLLVEAAQKELDVRQADERLAKLAVDECVVRAPKKGSVLRSFVRVGEMLGSNPMNPAMEYGSEGRRVVRAEIDQEFADRVFTGQTAMVQDDTRSGPVWTGKVTRVSLWQAKKREQLREPLVFNDVRTLEVIIELDSPPPLKIGQRLRVMLD